MSPRTPVYLLLLGWLLTPPAAPGQAVREEDGEAVTPSARQTPREGQAQPAPPEVVKGIIDHTNGFRREEGRKKVEPEPKLMWIPSLSQHLLVTTLIKDEPLTPAFVALSIGSTLAFGVLLGWLAVRLYRREAILG